MCYHIHMIGDNQMNETETLYRNCREVAISEHDAMLSEAKKMYQKLNALRMTIRGLSNYLNVSLPNQISGPLYKELVPNFPDKH